MGLADTLEKLFSVESETTIESAIMQFVTAGENFKSKTNLPFHRSVMAVALLSKFGEDMDSEFAEVMQYVNKDLGISWTKKGKLNPDRETPSKFINEIIDDSMILEPNLDSGSRKELLEAIKFRQDIKSKIKQDDTITKVQEWINR